MRDLSHTCSAMEETTERNGFTPIKLPPSSGPRPHRCDVCQRSFREVATLRKHEQLHRADRPYVCSTCGKSFLWSSNLKVHERVHTGERPYKCKICHRCFTQSNDLRRHERNVHMRGKLYGYKSAGRPNSHVNLAAYQAFALQQRALLQQALTYESFMQNAAAASHVNSFHPHPQQVMVQKPHETMSTSVPNHNPKESTSVSPIKLEQVTPPSTPSETDPETRNGLEKRSLSTTSPHTSDSLQSPLPSSYTPLSAGSAGMIQSPPLLMASSAPPMTYGKEEYSKNCYSPSVLQARRASENGYSPYHYGNGNLSPHGYVANQHNLPQAHGHITTSESSPSQQEDKTSSCDKVMDLSMGSKNSSENHESDLDDVELKASNGEHMPPPKTPSVESECDGKRDVTTTSASPMADSGIHHCEHCNIFFYDFTMYHLHQSLHSPYEEHPFCCPSCQKRCQDRIEFMFHIVWHVKYPNTIPNYQPFKESYLTS
ncbi:zinc finger protein 227-like isoform X1 [Haliotis rubra]|uniref:zinc finger protein 227-like isoform X1 n=2 Tax=Haliotis rubra TaxID=36100 RepID=UPI001EE595EE|nr:zinc finger protein 227-like isoform X1 [Haliotis rubra]